VNPATRISKYGNLTRIRNTPFATHLKLTYHVRERAA
jgi:hypothetical protein